MTTTMEAPCHHDPGTPTANFPRRDRVCRRCGRNIDGPRRDAEIERDFLADVDRLVEDLRGIAATPNETAAFKRMIHDRIAMGEERFGDAWTRRENLPEAHEETPDAVVYAMLELQRVLGATDPEVWNEARTDLVSGSAHMAIGFALFKAAERKLKAGE